MNQALSWSGQQDLNLRRAIGIIEGDSEVSRDSRPWPGHGEGVILRSDNSGRKALRFDSAGAGVESQ
jgi:hypothetical protein